MATNNELHCAFCGTHACRDRDLPSSIQVDTGEELFTLSQICARCGRAIATMFKTMPAVFKELVDMLGSIPGTSGEMLGNEKPTAPFAKKKAAIVSPAESPESLTVLPWKPLGKIKNP